MKYWIFQSNQVLGPYEPDDLSKHSSFGAESLVCPEGRRGTSMGDWQRAGMVPDLSVALVRAAQGSGAQSSVATLAGLPPEPTLKDLAVLGSLQEKVAMMESVVAQLQEGLRVKDAELAALHQELAGKDRQSSVMKSAMEHEAAGLKLETEARKREAEDLQAQTVEFKRKMTELEERLGVVGRLSETIDKAVEAEKHVEQDVEAHGATLADLAKEMEALRAQMSDRLSAAAPAPSPKPSPLPIPEPANVALDPVPTFPPYSGGVEPSSASAPKDPMTIPIDPMSGALPRPAEAPISVLESVAAPVVDAAPAPAKGGRKKAMLFGGLLGLVALGAFVFISGGNKRKNPRFPRT